jgi:hypothetical protein
LWPSAIDSERRCAFHSEGDTGGQLQPRCRKIGCSWPSGLEQRLVGVGTQLPLLFIDSRVWVHALALPFDEEVARPRESSPIPPIAGWWHGTCFNVTFAILSLLQGSHLDSKLDPGLPELVFGAKCRTLVGVHVGTTRVERHWGHEWMQREIPVKSQADFWWWMMNWNW